MRTRISYWTCPQRTPLVRIIMKRHERGGSLSWAAAAAARYQRHYGQCTAGKTAPEPHGPAFGSINIATVRESRASQCGRGGGSSSGIYRCVSRTAQNMCGNTHALLCNGKIPLWHLHLKRFRSVRCFVLWLWLVLLLLLLHLLLACMHFAHTCAHVDHPARPSERSGAPRREHWTDKRALN